MTFPAVFELYSLDGTNGFTIYGIKTGFLLGEFVSSAGDVNGDGFDDLLIGARNADPNGNKSGQSYVVFGRSSGFSASLDLSTLDGTNGFAIDGIEAFDYSGSSVSSAGDVNGDGFDDLLIGAPGAEHDGTRSGQIYVVFGRGGGFGASLKLSTLDGTNGFAIDGINAFDNSGNSVSSAGDVNGDGFDDLLIGALAADPNGNQSGQSYVVFGRSSGFSASLKLSTLDGTNGFALNGVNDGDFSGYSVSSAGDMNGDGFDDLLIGASYADPNGDRSGQSYVVFGRSSGFSASLNLSTLDGTNGFALNGIDIFDWSGRSVSSAGDINSDGFDDLLIGAPGAGLTGRSSVVFGRGGGFSASLNLSTLDGTNGFTINGINDHDRSGFSVSSAGDVNGDGFDDLLIGAPGVDPNGIPGITGDVGRSYVVFGRGDGFGASLDLSTLNGTNGFALGFAIYENVGVNSHSGWSVSSAGDVNGDGFDDLLIGAPGEFGSGQSYVVFGRSAFAFEPAITLAVSPSSILEDGTTNLVYTFTRTGNTTNALTVNYTIAGTATNGTDYGSIGNSVAFAADSSIATVTIDPITDTVLESDETVALTLANSPNYIIGTAGAVTGIITNDDVAPNPSITLAVSPNSVSENGIPNLIYTFTRTEDTLYALSVNFTIGGTATFNNDYTQNSSNVNISNGRIAFAAGSNTAIVTINPTADTNVEADETVILTLASGTGYNIGTTSAVTGTITNDDGDANNNRLVGGSGRDTLDGGVGYDTMIGGADDDTYFVDHIGDVITEILNEGTDTAKASLNYTLGDNLENLTLLGLDNLNGTGNSLNNTLTGNSGNNNLNGGIGDDTLIGGLGDDSYTLDNSADVVTERVNQGTDTVRVGFSYTLGNHLENLILAGNTEINGTGNSLNNTLTGNSAKNTLSGGNGNDILVARGGDDTLLGGFGNDTLTGGSGLDRFQFNNLTEGVDRITDFSIADDTIVVSAKGFGGGLKAGTPAPFIIGTAATSASTRFIYNSATGALLFDIDGNGVTAAVQFATLHTGLALTSADILFI